MFSKFFIERPIFATVVSVIICIAGLVSIAVMPIEQYPAITPVQVTVSATYPGADSKTLADSVAAPIEAQINGVDNMLYMSSTSSSNGHAVPYRLLRSQNQSGYRPGSGAEPGQPGPAAVAGGRDPAGCIGAEEIFVHHDDCRHHLQGESLQQQLHRQLCQCLCPGCHQKGAGRRTGVDPRRGGPGDAHLDESGPDGLARDYDQRYSAGGFVPECPVRGRPDRSATHIRAGAVDVSGGHPAALYRSLAVRKHHSAGQPGRQRNRAPEGCGPGRGRAQPVYHRQQAERQSRHLHRRLPAARRQWPESIARLCVRRWRR